MCILDNKNKHISTLSYITTVRVYIHYTLYINRKYFILIKLMAIKVESSWFINKMEMNCWVAYSIKLWFVCNVCGTKYFIQIASHFDWISCEMFGFSCYYTTSFFFDMETKHQQYISMGVGRGSSPLNPHNKCPRILVKSRAQIQKKAN